jgi:pyruvate/2-oxoglutarate dehydrogenase complex dihydrolipoamide acyltransferase (E2) component
MGAGEQPVPQISSPHVSPNSPGTTSAPAEKIRATPVAKRIAMEHGLDLRNVTGTGPGGRITREDVLLAVKEITAEPVIGPPEVVPGTYLGKEVSENIPIQGVRRVIFDNMYQSLSQSAQLTIHTEASAESIIGLRKRLKREEQDVSYNSILMKISAIALRQHPKINSSVDGDSIRVWEQVHIGLAMEVNEALMVPVIRNVDQKTIRAIDRDFSDLVQKAQENRLSPDDLVNGTFTITNLGFADVDHFTPIIRPPESAILGIGRIVRKPSVKNNQVLPEARISLSLTFDHRIIDGAPAARFLKTIKEMVEDPVMMIG